jgi:hypothetical protein
MNYTELTAAIQNYLQNAETSFVANIPTFVKQAEQRIYNSVQFPSLRKSATLTFTSGSANLEAPNDFLAPYSLAVIDGTGTYQFLLNKDANLSVRRTPPLLVQDCLSITLYLALEQPRLRKSLFWLAPRLIRRILPKSSIIFIRNRLLRHRQRGLAITLTLFYCMGVW